MSDRRPAEEDVRKIASLLHERNGIDERIAAVIERPMTAGHLGEWVAAQIFDIELETSAVTAAIDGRFRVGPLQGCTVNVKWYLKREGMIDIIESSALDYYLILAGPASAAMSSRGGRRPWCIEAVYLFDAQQLLDEQRARGIKLGESSVRAAQWAAAEIYPRATNRILPMSPGQAELLRLFAGGQPEGSAVE
ncbi:MAG: hypothetical protein ACRDTF_05725, partial [Pseudonocardiaceae bacterium]